MTAGFATVTTSISRMACRPIIADMTVCHLEFKKSLHARFTDIHRLSIQISATKIGGT
jgi:hypothetical protein